MAALMGTDGSLDLWREQPTPRILPSSAIGASTFTLNSNDFFHTQAVILVQAGGTRAGYLSVNETGLASLHATEALALNGATGTRLTLSPVGAATTIVTATGAGGQTTALQAALGSIAAPTREISLRAYPTSLAAWQAAASAVPIWSMQAELTAWSLKTSADTDDVTALGDKFGESVKTLITGSGSMEYLFKFYEGDNEDPSDIMRLALALETGCKAKGRFFLKRAGSLGDNCTNKDMQAALWYEADIMITGSATEFSTRGLATGSADFATTGRIRLLQSLAP